MLPSSETISYHEQLCEHCYNHHQSHKHYQRHNNHDHQQHPHHDHLQCPHHLSAINVDHWENVLLRHSGQHLHSKIIPIVPDDQNDGKIKMMMVVCLRSKKNVHKDIYISLSLFLCNLKTRST